MRRRLTWVAVGLPVFLACWGAFLAATRAALPSQDKHTGGVCKSGVAPDAAPSAHACSLRATHDRMGALLLAPAFSPPSPATRRP